MNEINTEILKKLIKIIEKRIKFINANIASSEQKLSRVNKYEELINTIKNDNQCFASPTFNTSLDELLGGLDLDNYKDKLELLFEKMSYLEVIANSILDGHYKSYDEQELEIINEVIELILFFKNVSHEQKSEERTIVSKSNEELVVCEALYDKLRNGTEGLEHFDNDLPYIMDLIGQEDIEFKKDVLILIQRLSKKIHENILNKIQEDEITAIGEFDFEEEESQQTIDEDLIRGVFAKYGFNYDFFTAKHKASIARISLRRIESVLEILSTYPEYKFVVDYQRLGQERSLFLIIKHATKETLKYLVDDAKKRGVTVQEIFGVNGVYKKVSKNKDADVIETGPDGERDDEYLSGSYEYYLKNADTFEMLSLKYNAANPGLNVDFFKDILAIAPEVLAVPSHLISENIELALQYGIKVVRKTKIGQVHAHAPTMFESRHFAELCDALIEKGLYDYLVAYPSALRDEKFVRKILYYKINNKLERTNSGKIKEVRFAPEPYDLDQVVNRNNLQKYIALVPGEIVAFVRDEDNKKLQTKLTSDPVMDAMDNTEDVNVVNDATYSIGGVLVSRHKFRRVWYLMTMSGDMNKANLSDLLMYALIYDSYYSDEELEVIDKFAHSFNFGGITLWNI